MRRRSSVAQGPRLDLAPFRATVTDAPVSYSVYSAFSFYGPRRGGELPGVWLVRALEALGHQTAAIRQTLYRMEASRELDSRAIGRTKLYRLSPFAGAEAGAGLAKIMERRPDSWDERWTLVQFLPGSEDRIERERLREILRAEGFARIGPGAHIHPRDRGKRLIAAARKHDAIDLVTVFRATRVDPGAETSLVARLWDLDDLAERYRQFEVRYRPLAHRENRFTAVESFQVRFAVVFDYLEVAWSDPDLPASLLPREWPGGAARRLARDLYRQLLPAAVGFADTLLPEP